MDISSKKVAIVVHNFFEQAEFVQPLESLKSSGAEVHVISASGEKELQGLNHVDKGNTFQADLLIDAADTAAYDALVLPGGAVNADNLRMVPAVKQWVQEFMNEGKIVAVICHAPWVLASSDVVNGKQLTSYFTIQDDMRNAGANWTDQTVVIDSNLITSRNPDDLPAFCSALIDTLQQ